SESRWTASCPAPRRGRGRTGIGAEARKGLVSYHPKSAPHVLAFTCRIGYRSRAGDMCMRLPIYQVDAFTDKLFGGNPAAVCPLESFLPDATMQAIAAENNLSETAFLVGEGGDYLLRWFTPTVEVDLCGHATLASAHVVFECLEPRRDVVRFRTLKAGTLEVRRSDGLLTMDFPARPPVPCEPPAELLTA